MTQLPRFEQRLAQWFERPSVPIWITEYDYRTDHAGVSYAQQAGYLRQALAMAVAQPAIEMFVWYVLRDDPDGPWPSGLLAANGRPKPAFGVFERAARALDARDPVVQVAPGRQPWVSLSARDLSYYDGVGAAIDVNYGIAEPGGAVRGGHVTARIGRDDRLRFPLAFRPRAARTYSVLVRGRDEHGNRLRRSLTLVSR